MLSQQFHDYSPEIQGSDRYFRDIYNQPLLNELKERFGSFFQHHVDVPVSTEVMLNMVKKMSRKKPRRGEVVMVVPTMKRKLWLHTKASYPEGVYRLMTGGLEPEEEPHAALKREAEEETGFAANIDQCLAVITYNLHNNGSTLPFVSYVFLTTPVGGVPKPVDSSEAITGFRSVSAQSMFDVAQQLRLLRGKFEDWGLFRSVAHEIVGHCLTK